MPIYKILLYLSGLEDPSLLSTGDKVVSKSRRFKKSHNLKNLQKSQESQVSEEFQKFQITSEIKKISKNLDSLKKLSQNSHFF